MDSAVRRSLSPLPSVLLVVALLFLFVGERLLGTGTARVVLDVLGGLLFAGAIFLRLLWLRAASLDAQRLAKLVLLCYGLIAAGLLAYVLQLFLADGADNEARLPAILYAAFFLLSCLGAVPLLALELTAMRMRPAAFVEWRRAKQAFVTGLSLTLALAALITFNYAATERPWRLDTSFAAPTTPSEATLNLVRTAPQPVQVYLFYAQGNRMLADIQDYFDAVREAGAEVIVQDQAVDPELAKELKISSNGQIGVRCGERNDKWHLGSEWDSSRTRIKKIDSELRKMLAKVSVAERKVYFTHGHGERANRSGKKEETPQGKILREVLKSFNAKHRQLGMADGSASAVPEDADLVVVFGPTGEFMPAEVAALRNYIKSGKSLLLMIDPKQELGLTPLLDDLGLQVGGEVCNDQTFYRYSHTQADHAFLITNSFTSHTITKPLNQARDKMAIALLGAGSLSKKGGAKGAKSTFVLRSMTKSFVDSVANRVFDEKSEKRAVLNLASAVELDGEGEQSARIFVVADADIFADMLVSNQANMVLSFQVIAWLLGDDKLGGEVAVEEDVPIQHTRDGDTLWFYGTTFAAPTLVLVLGLTFVYRKRRRRSAP